jgi:hypothetical protein
VENIFRDLFYTSEDGDAARRCGPEVSFPLRPQRRSRPGKDMLEEKGSKIPDGAYDSLLVLRDGRRMPT